MYLWIDLWDKRCGLAVYISGIVVPKTIVARTKLIQEIKKYILEYNIEVIVVGLPYDLYGRNLRQLDKTEAFMEKLEDIFPDIQIDGQDERFTSFEADTILFDMWVKNTEGQKDAISASLILESYLKQKNI